MIAVKQTYAEVKSSTLTENRLVGKKKEMKTVFSTGHHIIDAQG